VHTGDLIDYVAAAVLFLTGRLFLREDAAAEGVGTRPAAAWTRGDRDRRQRQPG
jgi:hypothetical protein